MENDIPSKQNPKEGVVIQVSGKAHCELKLIRRDKAGHYMLIKRDIVIVNIYALNVDGTNFIK
jgi:hypothetical protein